MLELVLAALATVALFLLPGLALLRLWPAPLPLDERLCMALGLSCALPPVLLLYAHLLYLPWGREACLLTLAGAAAIAFWPRRAFPPAEQPKQQQPSPWPLLLLLLITLAILAARFATVQGWVAGAFGDSYHHTLIAQLLVDNGGLFRSWEPYAPLASFTYHYGFHSLVAWLNWLSGYPTTLGLLAIGQAQSALAAPMAYLLAVRLLGSRSAGLWAAIFAGVVSTMPGYYVNWGRYTQLAGQIILVPCVLSWAALIDEACERQPRRNALLRLGTLAALATSGLILTHYRVTIFAGGFVVVYGLYRIITSVRSWASAGRLVGCGLLATVVAFLLALPWLLRTQEGSLMAIYGGYYLSTNVGTELGNAIPVSEISNYVPYSLTIPAGLGLLLCLFLRRWGALMLVGWAGLLALAANPYLIGLNGAGIVANFALLIAAYMALAPLAGAFPALVGELLARAVRSAPALRFAQLAAGVLVLALGLPWQASIGNPAAQLYTPADAQAVAWIRANLPPEAKIYVNSFGAYGGALWAGSDGGWWLPFLAAHQTNLPPFLHGQERGASPRYQAEVAAANEALQRNPLDSPLTAASLREAGYSYLYNGPAANPPGEYIDPGLLATSSLYEQVYNHAGVSIWRIR
jgi:hypothetical protein